MRPWYRMGRRLQGPVPAQHGSAHFSPSNGSVEIVTVLAPGVWQLAIDLGKFGIHRRSVEVRACEVAEVDVAVQ